MYLQVANWVDKLVSSVNKCVPHELFAVKFVNTKLSQYEVVAATFVAFGEFLVKNYLYL